MRAGSAARGPFVLVAMAVWGLGIGAVASPAAVTSNATTVTVSTTNARAVISRDPVRIAIQDSSGRTVLNQVGSSARTPRRFGPVVDPKPGAIGKTSDRGFYGPLTFEVGTERRTQWLFPGLWTGNMLTSVRWGSRNTATRVRSVVADADGVRLVLDTTDRRRMMEVRIAPDGADAIRIRARVLGGRAISIGASFVSGPDEQFHGFGGRHIDVDHRGKAFTGWSEQENLSVGSLSPIVRSFLGVDNRNRTMFPGGPMAAYYPQNIFYSSRPYGFMLNSTHFSRWRMASDRPDAWQFLVSDDEMDYSVAPGEPARAVGAITAMNGRHRVPPEWAQGPTLLRSVQIFGNETPETYKAKVERDLAELERREPSVVTAYAFEGAAVLDAPFVTRTIERLNALGIKAMAYIRVYVSGDGALTQNPADYATALREGYVVKRPSGGPFTWISGFSNDRAAMIDFTNPRAVTWWQGRLRAMLDLGFEGFMQDFGEGIVDEMRFSDGSTGLEMHNRFATLAHKTTRAFVDGYEAEHRNRQIFFYTRAGFSGRPGAAAYEQSNFAGDATTDCSQSRYPFPAGCWRAPETGQEYAGQQAVEVPAPLERLPYFVRCGTDPLGAAAG